MSHNGLSGLSAARTSSLLWLIDLHALSLNLFLQLSLILLLELLQILGSRALALKVLGLIALVLCDDSAHGIVTVGLGSVLGALSGLILIVLVVLKLGLFGAVLLAVGDKVGLWLLWWVKWWGRLLRVPERLVSDCYLKCTPEGMTE